MSSLIYVPAKKNGQITVNKTLTELVSTPQYGTLYNWYTCIDPKGICPVGWHIPTWSDFVDLRNTTERSYHAYNGAYKLMESGTTWWTNNNGTNDFGFNGRGTGIRSTVGGFGGVKDISRIWFWSDLNDAGTIDLQNNQDILNATDFKNSKSSGNPIRLVKDNNINTGTVTDYDSNIYNTVTIGNRVWMASNLITEHFNDGTSIPNVTGTTAWSGLTTSAMCYYNNTKSNAYTQAYQQVSGDTTQFPITITGQKPLRPHIETKSASTITQAVFEDLVYDTYIVTENQPVWVTSVIIDDNSVELWGGHKSQVVNINNSATTYTECSATTLRFTSVGNNQIGLLSAGLVTGTSVTIGSYVIEWHLNSITGSTVLTTGLGSDPSIQRFHPFTDEPVVGGQLYAVVRWIDINGVRYSSVKHMYGQYSPDLSTCLGSVTVTIMSCSNGNGNYGYNGTIYKQLVSYTNTVQSATLASRTLRYDLNPDGSSKYLAFLIVGNEVSDRFRFYYVTSSGETLVNDWVVGSDIPSVNYYSTPRMAGSPLKDMISLTGRTYTSGDYIKIQIDPSYIATANTNTNWAIYLKCLTTADNINFNFPSNLVNNTLSFTPLAWDAVNCRYYLNVISETGYTYSEIYLQGIWYLINNFYGTSTDWTASSPLYMSKQTNGYAQFARNLGSYIETSQTYTISKTGTTLTLQFQNVNDYNIYKNGLNLSLANANWTNYSTDPTNTNHYKFIEEGFHIANSLGDAYTYIQFNVWYESTWTLYDGLFKITCDCATQTLGYSDSDCNNTYEAIQPRIGQFNSMATGSTFSYTTKITHQYPLGNAYINVSSTYQTDSQHVANLQVPNGLVSRVTPTLYPEWFLSNDMWYYYKRYLRIIFTDVNDPLNHYDIYTLLNSTTGTLFGTWQLLLSVNNTTTTTTLTPTTTTTTTIGDTTTTTTTLADTTTTTTTV